MGRLRKTLTAALVWLTAGMTAVAATPHFSCRCADGSVKPFCLGWGGGVTGGCCGHCCATAQDDRHADKGVVPGQQSKAPCPHCRGMAARTSPSKTSTSGLGQPCCTKTTAQPAAFSVSAAKTKLSKDLTPGPFVAAEIAQSFGLPAVHAVRTSWYIDQSPPPTDRVIVLQHFLI